MILTYQIKLHVQGGLVRFKIGEEAIVLPSVYGPPIDGTVVTILEFLIDAGIYTARSANYGKLAFFPSELRKVTKLDKAMK